MVNLLLALSVIASTPVVRAHPVTPLAVQSKTTQGASADAATAGASADGIDLTLPQEDVDRAVVEGTLKANEDECRRLVRKWTDDSGVDESEYAAGVSDHVRILGKFKREEIKTLVQIAEYVYRRLNWITDGKTDTKWLKRAYGGKSLYYFTDKNTFADLVSFLTKTGVVSRKTAKNILDLSTETGVGGYGQATPKPLCARKNRQHPASCVANNLGSNWLHYNAGLAMREVNLRTGLPQGHGSGGRGRGHYMEWLSEGVGMWASIDAIGANNFWRVTKQIYKNVGRAEKGKDSDRIAICYELAATDDPEVKPPKGSKNLYSLTRTKLNNLTDIDLAMSWSITDYLIRYRTQDWRKLIKWCRRVPSFRQAAIRTLGTDAERSRLDKIIAAKDEGGLDQIYKTVIGRFEEQWKKWASAQYKAEYENPSAKKASHAPFQEIAVAGDEDDEEEGKGKKPKRKRRRRR